MAINYRYALRLATDLALGLFLLFAAGGLLWTADEVMNWNLLPDWIDKYAQVIVIVLGAAAGLAIGTALLCAVALHAEAAAEQAHIPVYQPRRRTWKFALAGALLVGAVFLVSSEVDAYRKAAALSRRRNQELVTYRKSVLTLQDAARRAAALFPPTAVTGLERGGATAADSDLIRFLSAVSSSTESHPSVGLLVRAAQPYEYCRIRLVPRPAQPGESAVERFGLDRQFYLSFPTVDETETIRRLFSGQLEPVQARLEGEVLTTVRPSAWSLIRLDGTVVGLLVLHREETPGFDFRHFGPAVAL